MPRLVVAGCALVLLVCAAHAAQTEPPARAALLEQYRAHPTDWKLCNQIGLSYTESQEFDQAAKFYRKVTELNPSFLPARKNLAVVLWFAGRKAEAEPIFRKLASAIPNDPVPHLYLGLADHDAGRFSEAKRHFSLAGDLAMKNPEVLPAVVGSYLAAGDVSVVPVALAALEEIHDPQLTTRVSAAFSNSGQFNATRQAFEKMPPEDADGMLLLAEAYDKTGAPDRAYATYARSLAVDPRNERGYTALAAFAANHQNRSYGIEVLDKGLLNLPGSATLLLNRGLLIALDGDGERAERDLRAAGAANPKWSLPVLALGVLRLESGRTTEAVETFRIAAKTFPKDEHAFYFLGLALSRTGEDADRTQAIPALKSALAIAPDFTRARVLLGRVYVDSGRLEEGTVELKRSLRTEPQNPGANYTLALAYRKLGRIDLADRYTAAFRAAKAEADERQTEFIQILKILK